MLRVATIQRTSLSGFMWDIIRVHTRSIESYRTVHALFSADGLNTAFRHSESGRKGICSDSDVSRLILIIFFNHPDFSKSR